MIRNCLLLLLLLATISAAMAGCAKPVRVEEHLEIEITPQEYWKQTWLVLKPGDRIYHSEPHGIIDGVAWAKGVDFVNTIAVKCLPSGLTKVVGSDQTQDQLANQPRVLKQFPFASLIYRVGNRYYFGGKEDEFTVAPGEGGSLAIGINMFEDADYKSYFVGSYKAHFAVTTSK